MSRSYTELSKLETFEERFEYLSIKGMTFEATFGSERWLNQRFYTSSEWRRVRRDVIARDYGLDLGVDGYEIHDKIVIHHMNPMVPEDILNIEFDDSILNPEYLITVSHRTHNAIHYSTSSPETTFVERRPNDHILW